MHVEVGVGAAVLAGGEHQISDKFIHLLRQLVKVLGFLAPLVRALKLGPLLLDLLLQAASAVDSTAAAAEGAREPGQAEADFAADVA